MNIDPASASGPGPYRIVTMSRAHAEQAWAWAKQEGWNPGLEDHLLLPQIDPHGCLALVIPDPQDAQHERMIGSITAVNYGGFGFIGMFLVHPDFQGKGYGTILSRSIADRITSLSNIGIDAVQERIPLYTSLGFQRAYDTPRYRLAHGRSLPTEHATAFVDTDFEAVAAYDTEVFRVSRKGFLKAWIASPHADTAVMRHHGKVVGYGVARDCYEGRKIGPLFADDAEIAQDILGLLLSKRRDHDHYLDLPKPAPHGDSLVGAAEAVFVCTRMYSGEDPKQDIRKVYGNTTFEMG